MLNIKQKVKTLVGYTPDNITAEILSADVPLILKDFSAKWPIVIAGRKSAKAAADYLLQFYQGMPINASYLTAKEQGRVYYNANMTGFNFESKQQDLQQVLDDIFAQVGKSDPSSIYVSSTGIKQFLPGLGDEAKASSSLDDSIVNIWLGSRSRIAAHYDFAQNLACCVVGHRRFTLFPPEQVKNLYVGPLDKAPGGQEISTVNFANPDFQRQPKFKLAIQAAQVADLAPGDALVLPSMWWHHVEGLDDFNVLITHWWRNNSSAYMGRPTNALLHSILSIRDLPQVQRDAWKCLFEHYVFDFKDENFEHIPKEAKSFLASPLDELSARKIRADLQNKLRR